MRVANAKTFLRTLRGRRPGAEAGGRRHAARPTVEGLEERIVLYTTNGGVWTYPIRITYSFVPDGTNLGGVSSNMFATLNSYESTATWQHAIEEAAAIWSQETNINLTLVSDNGAPEGIAGNQQDDPRFGDIRIGMSNQGTGYLAYTESPPPVNGGTDAGDITFNSYYSWSPNGGYDLETVALHELGHALGLGESSSWGAVMYPYYGGVNTTPTNDDIAGIQSLYGVTNAPYGSNKTPTTAYNLSSMLNSSGQLALANQSIQSGNDATYWAITVPSTTTGTMNVQLQSTNLSSLAPRLIVLNSSYSVLGTNSLPNSYGATATLSVAGVTPGQTYIIRVAAASGIGAVGAYGLLINFGSSYQAPIAPPNTVVASQPDQGGGIGFEYVAPTVPKNEALAPWLGILGEESGSGALNVQGWVNALSRFESGSVNSIFAALASSSRATLTTTKPDLSLQPTVFVNIKGTSLETTPGSSVKAVDEALSSFGSLGGKGKYVWQSSN